MRPFTVLAHIYNQMMEHVDYKKWIDYIEEIVRRYGIRGRRVLDLACGTGIMSSILSRRGYSVVGIDSSREMIREARRKSEGKVEFRQQDMRSLETGNEHYHVVLCVYDSLNYILRREEIGLLFRKVFGLLEEGGVFIFDVVTEKNILDNYNGKILAENRKGFSYIWESAYNRDESICESRIAFFVKGKLGGYRRREEIHQQRIYNSEELKGLLRDNGFRRVECFDAFRFEEPTDASERINFVALK